MPLCGICLEELTESVQSIITECNHEFHQHCLLRNIAMARNGKNKCPNCRHEYFPPIKHLGGRPHLRNVDNWVPNRIPPRPELNAQPLSIICVKSFRDAAVLICKWCLNMLLNVVSLYLIIRAVSHFLVTWNLYSLLGIYRTYFIVNNVIRPLSSCIK